MATAAPDQLAIAGREEWRRNGRFDTSDPGLQARGERALPPSGASQVDRRSAAAGCISIRGALRHVGEACSTQCIPGAVIMLLS